MHVANHWGGTYEIQTEPITEDGHSHDMDLDPAALFQPSSYEIQQGWLLGPQKTKREERYVDLGCIIVKRKAFKWAVLSILIAFSVVGMPSIIAKYLPKHKERVSPPDEYTVVLHKALLFFNAQRSGHLPKNNGVSWRDDSGLRDGYPTVKNGLVGGYYDAGDNIKYHFPMAFSMTLLSWSVIEYSHKYRAIKEYDHIRDIIKWGTDYLLLTFNSSASTIGLIYSQVGSARKDFGLQNDGKCWQRPEDMTYARPTQTSWSAPDLGSEMAAALAAASIVFSDDTAYSRKLIKGAELLFDFAVNRGDKTSYSSGNLFIEPFYNSTGYWDELMWSAIWMYYATGNKTYLSYAMDEDILSNAKAFLQKPDLNVLSWDNKLPGARLLLSRFRIFMNPGYPYEDVLRRYHDAANRNMCSYFRQFHVFKWTAGGLIQLNNGGNRSLQYVANAAFLASLFADYMNATKVPGWYCGPTFISSSMLRNFAASQVNYILGDNPKKMSYVVGYGQNYPKYVHHRGASTPHDGGKFTCTGGMKWYFEKRPNPNVITGAMVGGPDHFDHFSDMRSRSNNTEPTLAGNAGLVAALVSLTNSGGGGIDRNTIFTAVPPFFLSSPPPPLPWKP